MSSSQDKDGANSTMDLQSKYNKLAAEFAKLRAQLPVLKRAVVDEKSKNEELTEALKLRDQSNRKLEQEVDSLSFRNKQLEKRIGVLQTEVAEITVKSKSRKQHKDVQQGQMEFSQGPSLDHELISKIEENMQLQQKLSDLEQSNNFEIDTLKSQLESLSNEETHKELILNELASLKSENKSLAHALQNSLDEIEAFREQVKQMKEKIAKPIDNGSSYSNAKTIGIHTTRSSSLESTSNESLPEKIEPTDLLEKLKSSEQQREYWLLEYQLLKMKYERILKKWEDCKDILKSLGREDLLQLGSSEVTSPTLETGSNVIGRMEIVSSDGSDVEIRGRSYEKEVKEHMSNKVNELVALLQYADSRAVHFYNECKTMESLLTIACGKTQTLQEQLQTTQTKQVELKDELDVTKENYEVQLKQLSEHLALMNEKIAEKQEKIIELQAKSKGKK